MAYTGHYKLEATMPTEQDEINALCMRIAVSFVLRLVKYKAVYSPNEIYIEQTPEELTFTVNADDTGSVDPEHFNLCFAQAVRAVQQYSQVL